jgi:hypothetical protein
MPDLTHLPTSLLEERLEMLDRLIQAERDWHALPPLNAALQACLDELARRDVEGDHK